MNWDKRIIGRAEPAGAVEKVEQLFARQLPSWPLLRTGVENLERARVKRLCIRWFEVLVRHIPHRIASTTARVDPASIRERACFLCPDSLPEEERGVEFGDEFVILPNPYPILDRHVSVVRREHVPQRIAGELSTMLDLARALPGYMVLYNGPECGASAPDHLHFQACRNEMVPAIADVARLRGVVIEDYARHVLVLRETDPAAVSDRFDDVMDRLEDVDPDRLEPMVNVVVFFDGTEWVVMVFPRGKHRPEAYASGELTFSPASIDLCGVPVLPVESDFEKVDSATIEHIFTEVTIAPSVFDEIVDALESVK